MKSRGIIILIVLAAALLACGGTDDPLYPDIYVNPTIGSDSNDGTYNQPFKTISKAMIEATSGEVVQAENGTYSTASGETFPIYITNGVALLGDEADKGALTVIDGMGTVSGPVQAAVVTGENTLLAGFLIRTSLPGTIDSGAVYVNRTSVTVRNNKLTGSYWGLFSDNGPATVRVEGNIINSNTYGVDLKHVGMDLGGGAASSSGSNHITCNTQSDVYMAVDNPGNSANAQNNYWDHTPPNESSTPSAGLDIEIKYIGNTIDTAGDALTSSPCP